MKRILIPLLWFLAGSSAGAQMLRGTVTDSASRAPVPGAVVQLLAADGLVLSRTITNRLGEYALFAADAKGVRVQRIGFRPREFALAPNTESGATLNVTLIPIPAFLDPMRVVASQCGRRSTRRGAVSPVALIEQARAGLLTTVVSRDVNPAAVRRYTYERTMRGTSDRIDRQVMRVDSAPAATTSFSAVHDAEGFIRRGFLEDGGGEQTYFAPDADVLLDAGFAAGYCFYVMPPHRDRRSQIGLGFYAANSRRGRVDIAGALWIDTVARELRDIEFRYIGLSARAESYEPGGRITFRAMENGIVVVERWELNLLGLRTDTLATTTRRGAVRVDSYFRHESGGVLGRATWRDGTTWRASLGTVKGHATWSDDRPAANVHLVLRGTPYRAVTDSLGAFQIADVVAGAYAFVVIDSTLATIGVTNAPSPAFTVGSDTVTVPVRAQTAEDFTIEQCVKLERYNRAAARVYFLGRAVTSAGAPIENVRWTVRQLGSDGWEDVAVDGQTGSDGLMPLCLGLVRNAQMEIVATSPDGERRRVQFSLTERATVFPIVF